MTTSRTTSCSSGGAASCRSGWDTRSIDAADDGFRYDAVHDSELTNVLLQLVATDDERDVALHFAHMPGAQIHTDLTSIVMGAEQSNTSLVFGDEYILKLFRKLSPGVNPDLEITRALAELGATAVVPPARLARGRACTAS